MRLKESCEWQLVPSLRLSIGSLCVRGKSLYKCVADLMGQAENERFRRAREGDEALRARGAVLQVGDGWRRV